MPIYKYFILIPVRRFPLPYPKECKLFIFITLECQQTVASQNIHTTKFVNFHRFPHFISTESLTAVDDFHFPSPSAGRLPADRDPSTFQKPMIELNSGSVLPCATLRGEDHLCLPRHKICKLNSYFRKQIPN